jgi:hypothetical protein
MPLSPLIFTVELTLGKLVSDLLLLELKISLMLKAVALSFMISLLKAGVNHS